MSLNRPHAEMTVLIADDSKLARNLLAQQVMAFAPDAVVIEAADGREAAAEFDAVRPTATFLDIHMPERSGVEALADIRAIDRDAPVFLVSADRSVERVRQTRELAATGYVTKPFSMRQIQCALERISSPRNDKRRVLMVDDSRTHREIMKKIIASLNVPCTIDEAGDGGDGVARYFNDAYDLVLLDVNMPRFGGLLALEEIMLKDAAANVVMISASRDPEIVQECSGLGARDFLYKPVPPEMLRAALEGGTALVA